MAVKEELVSVIMPVYNTEKYVGMAMESVMHQTYKNVELVVVDDGSTDNTLDMIRQYADVWQGRIRFSAREKNGGTAAALNDAIELAEGDYICWLSADDFYCEDMVESEVDFLRRNTGCSAVFSRCAFIDENSRFLGEQDYTYNKDFIANGMEGIIARLLVGNFWNGCSVLAKAECFKKGERFNVAYKGAQDYDFWLRMAADYDIGYLDKVNVLSRVHGEQGSRKINCRVDEIDVFFHLLCREDLMLKLYQKMRIAYTYENILPYIKVRIERYRGMEVEMNAMSQGLKTYMNMVENGQIHFQSQSDRREL